MSRSSDNETGVYAGILVHETDKAKRIDFGGDLPVWIPKSQIKSEKPSGSTCIDFELPTWLAIEKGLE